MDATVGSVVKLETKSGAFEGQIHSVDRIHKRLTIDKVILSETKERLPGRQHFFHNEITNIILLEDAKPIKKVKEFRHGRSIVKKKQIPTHLSKLKNLDNNVILLAKQDLPSSATEDGQSKVEGKSADETGSEEASTADNFHILTEINENFMQAIEYLLKQKIIGFAAEGIELGRNGRLCWIQMATRDEIIIFDMISLGKNGLEAGIGKIMECPNIQKIIHDCRNLSDLFFHQYGMKLINVFDTQVAAAIIYRNENGGYFPNYVESLPQCVTIYLEDVDEDKLIWTKYREERQEEDMAVWAERPARRAVVRLAARKVQHLLDLRVALMEKMLEDFRSGVDIFLSVIRDSSAIELKHNHYKMQPHLLPHQFKNLRYEASMRKCHYADRYKGSKIWDGESSTEFKESCINLDPTIVYSHDSIWHENTRPYSQGRRRGVRAFRQGYQERKVKEMTGATVSFDQESDTAEGKFEGGLRNFNKSPNNNPLPNETEVVSQMSSVQISDKDAGKFKGGHVDNNKSVDNSCLPENGFAEVVSPKNGLQNSDKENLKMKDYNCEPHTTDTQAVGRSITDLLYDLTSDESDEEFSSAPNDSSKFRFIAAGYESRSSGVKTANASTVQCSPTNSAEDEETNLCVIPTRSRGGTTLNFSVPKETENSVESKKSVVRSPGHNSGSADSVNAAGQPKMSPQHRKTLDTSSKGTLFDSCDSGNESGQACNSPRRGLGRGALMKSFCGSA